uniref:Uncharacterized protein n=1 Tax=Octopus bimaculoides TaxID=37653 RepID=A0A0L8FKK3_OCTBM
MNAVLIWCKWKHVYLRQHRYVPKSNFSDTCCQLNGRTCMLATLNEQVTVPYHFRDKLSFVYIYIFLFVTFG